MKEIVYGKCMYTHNTYHIAKAFAGQIFHQAQLPLYCLFLANVASVAIFSIIIQNKNLLIIILPTRLGGEIYT